MVAATPSKTYIVSGTITFSLKVDALDVREAHDKAALVLEALHYQDEGLIADNASEWEVRTERVKALE